MPSASPLEAALKWHRKRIEVPFLLARAEAIGAYARLEDALSYVFNILLGTDTNISSIVFWRIVNTTFRNQILVRLVEARYGTSFKKFFPSLIALVRQCDEERNKIIHWTPKLEHEPSLPLAEKMKAPFGTYMSLAPPGARDTHDQRLGLTIKQLVAFKEKCEFVLNSVTAFGIYRQAVSKHLPDKVATRLLTDPEFESWRQIFRQLVTYPPPNTHPLSPKQKARKTRRRSSRA